VVNTAPVANNIKILLRAQRPHQHDRAVQRLPLQLRHAILVRQAPQLLKLLIVVQWVRAALVDVDALVVEPDGEAIEDARVGVVEVELQRRGFEVRAVVVEVVEEDRVLGEDAERDMEAFVALTFGAHVKRDGGSAIDAPLESQFANPIPTSILTPSISLAACKVILRGFLTLNWQSASLLTFLSFFQARKGLATTRLLERS
jgi:hypothetical protein